MADGERPRGTGTSATGLRLSLCAAVVACEPYGVMDPAGLDDPGQGDMPEAEPAPARPEPLPPPCGPLRPWRRPGGGGGPAGHDADWQLAPRLPEGWNQDASVENVDRADACGRTVRVEAWEGCINADNCTDHRTWSVEYDGQGNLVSETRAWETFIVMDHGSIAIDHGYDERGARIWTQTLDMNERPAEAVLQRVGGNWTPKRAARCARWPRSRGCTTGGGCTEVLPHRLGAPRRWPAGCSGLRSRWTISADPLRA
jgi:YD repeat-containing protein